MLLTIAEAGQDAVGGEVPTSKPGAQLAQLHVHQPFLDHCN